MESARGREGEGEGEKEGEKEGEAGEESRHSIKNLRTVGGQGHTVSPLSREPCIEIVGVAVIIIPVAWTFC